MNAPKLDSKRGLVLTDVYSCVTGDEAAQVLSYILTPDTTGLINLPSYVPFPWIILAGLKAHTIHIAQHVLDQTCSEHCSRASCFQVKMSGAFPEATTQRRAKKASCLQSDQQGSKNSACPCFFIVLSNGTVVGVGWQFVCSGGRRTLQLAMLDLWCHRVDMIRSSLTVLCSLMPCNDPMTSHEAPSAELENDWLIRLT